MFLYDVIKRYPSEYDKDLVIFKVQNISDYVFENKKDFVNTDKDPSCEKNVISYLPPFDQTWFEFVNRYNNVKVGFLTTNFNIKRLREIKDYDPKGQYNILRDGIPEEYKLSYDACVWMLTAVEYSSDSPLLAKQMHMYFLDEKGVPVLSNQFARCSVKITADSSAEDKFESIELFGGDVDAWCAPLNTLFMSLNFLHCRNIEKVENLTPPKLVKSRKKDNKPYVEKFYTLMVVPMTSRSKTISTGTGAKKSLHIVRGVLRHYENGPGLFGKYKGTYWVPAHVRGNKDVGKINKDYEIKKPN